MRVAPALIVIALLGIARFPDGSIEDGTRSAQAAVRPISGVVRHVIDGDGLRLSTGHEIRLGDFDAPEWNERGGRAASAALTDIALGKTVECRPCEGARNPRTCTSYDRIIATCRLNGRRLGDLMRSRGIAEGGR